jgi:hypothetical protein
MSHGTLLASVFVSTALHAQESVKAPFTPTPTVVSGIVETDARPTIVPEPRGVFRPRLPWVRAVDTVVIRGDDGVRYLVKGPLVNALLVGTGKRVRLVGLARNHPYVREGESLVRVVQLVEPRLVLQRDTALTFLVWNRRASTRLKEGTALAATGPAAHTENMLLVPSLGLVDPAAVFVSPEQAPSKARIRGYAPEVTVTKATVTEIKVSDDRANDQEWQLPARVVVTTDDGRTLLVRSSPLATALAYRQLRRCRLLLAGVVVPASESDPPRVGEPRVSELVQPHLVSFAPGRLEVGPGQTVELPAFTAFPVGEGSRLNVREARGSAALHVEVGVERDGRLLTGFLEGGVSRILAVEGVSRRSTTSGVVNRIVELVGKRATERRRRRGK